MNVTLFNVEEENLICIFDTSSRTALIDGITDAIPYFDEPELQEIAEHVLRKLEPISDMAFAVHIFHPAYYYNDDDDMEDIETDAE